MKPVSTPGRSCPVSYHYGPDVFRAPAAASLTDLEVLYVVGGLYGNELALREVLRCFAAESGRKRIVFNGDFHWFDVDAARFSRIQETVLAHTALRGNVETELAQPTLDDDAGCGCAYPEWVDDGVVDRSNRILRRLWRVATTAQREQLAALPMWVVATVGECRLGIVHGDAQSLAGWGFAQEHMAEAAGLEQVRDWLHRARVDAFASSHTCLPVFQRVNLECEPRAGWIFNNGAAGMPNFRDDCAGLVTRLALSPCDRSLSRGGVVHRGVYVDALALQMDPLAVQAEFLEQWPAGSDAHVSYFDRIGKGPVYERHQMVRTHSSVAIQNR